MSSTQFHQLQLADVRQETDTAVCLTFAVPENLRETFSFIQGQYLTLESDVGGESIRRSYSICSGVDDGKLQVAVKAIDGGVFSTYANSQLRAGDSLNVMPPQGNFYTQLNSENKKHYMCICAGSGITPMLSIIKSVLSREPKSSVTLLYGNKNSASVMFKDELNFVKNRYMTRFNWVNV
ncbi:MAG: FAD-binding oxidoreductase, partial [Porticoccaceae bacterium]